MTITTATTRLTFRSATPADKETVVRFNLLLARSLGRMVDPAAVGRGVRAILSDPALGTYVLATEGSEVLGQIQLAPLFDDWHDGIVWWADGLSVPTQHRRFGTAGALVRHVLSAAAADPRVKAVRGELPDDAENHEALRHFYERLGFRRTGVVIERPAAPVGTPIVVRHPALARCRKPSP